MSSSISSESDLRTESNTLITWQPSIGSQQERTKLRSLFVDPSLVNESLMAIDIGNKGGICYNMGSKIVFYPMPWDTKENPDPHLTLKKWRSISEPNPDIIVAEDVHAFAGQGIVSTGTLMKNRGQIEMASAAMGLNANFIQPLSWIECYTMKRKKHFK